MMKFGGTSVADAEHIREVARIVRERLARKPVVIVSAHAGVTDQLDQIGRDAVLGHADAAPLAERHAKLLHDLGLDPSLLAPLLHEIETLLKGIELVRELSARTRDMVHSFGERLSVRTVAAHFCSVGIPAVAIDAFDAGLITDSNYGRARPLPEAEKKIYETLRNIPGVPVITGYIGKDLNGHITTLGRNGSDYSGAIFGNALNVEEIQIWTDVDGVMTADPRVVPLAQSIPEMTYEEAGELAYYGGKVLHPATIQPAVAKKIPVRVLNTKKPVSPGTLIEQRVPGDALPVTSITSRRGVAMLNVISTRMLGQSGFMARLFDEFGKREIVIDHIATSEVSVTLTTDAHSDLESIERALKEIADLEVERGKATVSIVGRGMRSHPEVVSKALLTLHQAGIAPQLITQSALRSSLSLLVEESQASAAVRALHQSFFEMAPADIPRAARAGA
ncbi:MAG: aspartate kinase [Planctomycetes bacterium]|nr:aspartate kinase [Planctomycetota bacterium]